MRLHPSIRFTLLAAPLLLAAAGAHAADLRLTIAGASGPGQVYAKLFADAASFDKLGAAVAALILTPVDGQVTATIGNLPPGRYAVAAFQDTKGTGKLETTATGMPTEPYGFSNDAVGVAGPPGFDRAAVTVGPEGASITLHVK